MSGWWERYCAERWPPVHFTVHAEDGRVLAIVEGFERALSVQRALHDGEDVRRESDGALCATKRRVRGGHIYAGIWGMRVDPAWVSQ